MQSDNGNLDEHASQIDKFMNDFDKWTEEYMEKSKKEMNQLNQVMNDFKEKQENLSNKIRSSGKYLSSFAKQYKVLKNNRENTNNDDYNQRFCDRIKQIKQINSDIFSLLPKRPYWFLRKCIGNVNISLYWERYNYKEEYEDFKMKSNLIAIFLSCLFWKLLPYRICDHLIHCFAIWYYSSLTIQEGILSQNGSRIKFWWKSHHFISIFYVALMVLWPYDNSYFLYRSSHYKLGLIQSLSQLFQFKYQKIQLYRLKTMGTSPAMEVTSDWPKFKTWTTGFSLMVPVLLSLYCYQIYMSFLLFGLYYTYYYWQIFVTACFMICFSIGNSYTLLTVAYFKFAY